MSLAELWSNSREQLDNKHVHQIIAFAGTGQLTDGGPGAAEFRELLGLVPSEHLARYSEECLLASFPGSGFALQDVVNQIGRRLGYSVVDGRYRGTTNQVGFDGLWKFPDGHMVVIEVKTTDAYRIDLGTVANYRRELIGSGQVSEECSSILMVVGRQDTGDLEAHYQKSFLEGASNGFLVLGCGSPKTVFAIPATDVFPWLPDMWITQLEDRFYWHIRIHEEAGRYSWDRRAGLGRIDVTKYLLPVG